MMICGVCLLQDPGPKVVLGSRKARHRGVTLGNTVSSQVWDLVVFVTIEASRSSCGTGWHSEHWLSGCSSVYMGNG